jgi:non-ribosomal peptide synthetase-like protein
MNETDKRKKLEADIRRSRRCLWGLHFLAIALLAVSLFPPLLFFYSLWKGLGASAPAIKLAAVAFSLGFGYFLFGLTLIFACVAAKNIFRFKITPGLHPVYSDGFNRWMAYNSLILIANSAFLDVLRISPFQNLFYALMGAKLGKEVNVNTGGLADLSMLEFGDNVMIGGGVALVCHAVDRGFLKLDPTKIGSNVSIGLNSVIMPGCEIGDGASIQPCTYLPKGSKIPPKGVWGGNPARDLRAERRATLETES